VKAFTESSLNYTQAKLEENALILSSKYKVETKVIAADLSNINSYELIKNELRGTQVDVLVNNVGGGEVEYDFFSFKLQISLIECFSSQRASIHGVG